MGCRTRVMGNTYDPTREIAYGRGNLSFTSINLPRIAIEAKGDEKVFYEKLEAMLELVAQQLLDRFEIQASKHIYNYPFLMGQGIWLDSDNLTLEDDLREVLKHGTLSIGFIGLAETLTSLYGKHHGCAEEIQNKGLEILGFMRKFCDNKSSELKMNFSLLGTPAEGLSGRFVKIDKEDLAAATDENIVVAYDADIKVWLDDLIDAEIVEQRIFVNAYTDIEETRYCIPSVADTLEALRDSYFSKVINPLKMPKADKDKLKETQAKVSEVRKSIRIKNAQKRNCRNALTKELAKPDCDKSVAQILNAQIEDCDRDIAALYRKAHTIEKEVELLMQGGGLVDAE